MRNPRCSVSDPLEIHVMPMFRRLVSRLTVLVVAAAVFDRARNSFRRRRDAKPSGTLPSLGDVHPAARSAPRRRLGLQIVPLDRIVGTVRHPSQNTRDFRPLPRLRGANWRGRWQRIIRATDRLDVLPPIELIQAGEDYYVVDGHNRVAAALVNGGIEIDADVTQLLLPGTQPGRAMLDAGSLIGTDEVRQAGQGRRSRTVEQRSATEDVPRRDIPAATDPDR